MTKRRRERDTRPNFNASGWADGLDLILAMAVLLGALAFAFFPR